MRSESIPQTTNTIQLELQKTREILSEIFKKIELDNDSPAEQGRPINNKLDGVVYEIELINSNLLEINRILEIIGK